MIEALHNANVIGLVYDGTGVCMLGLPSLLTSAKDIGNESGTYWGGNNALLQRLVLNKLDTTAGSLMLVAGFVLQLLATLKVSLDFSTVIVLWVMLVGFPLGYFLFGRPRLVVHYMKGASSERSSSA